MSIDECIREYRMILPKIHSTRLAGWRFRQLLGTPYLDSKIYEATIKEIIQKAVCSDPLTCHSTEFGGLKVISLSSLLETQTNAEKSKFQDDTRGCKV